MTPLEISAFLHHATRVDAYPLPSSAYRAAISELQVRGLLTHDIDEGWSETEAGVRLREALCAIPMRDPGEMATVTIDDALAKKLVDAMDESDGASLEELVTEAKKRQGAVSISVGVGTHPQGGQSVLLIVSDDELTHHIDLPPDHARIMSKQFASTADAIDSERERTMAWNRRYKDHPDA
jgi:hypothetical protein